MSNNKYIIDKDSLTGIADAVRDKLGVGEATTDPQTGDIVYPEDKGYYLKEDLIAKFNMGDRNIQGGHYSAGNATYLTLGSASDSTDYDVYFQRPFYSATLSFTHSGTTSRYHTLSVNGVSSTNIYGSTTKNFTFSMPQSYLTISSDMESAYGTDTAYYQNLTVTLFDQNGNNIKVKTTSIYSYDFLTGIVPERIPYSIDDIRNKIVNLPRGGFKIFKCYNNSSISRSEGDGWKVSNYLKLSGYFDIDFSSTSPSYITTQVPDLNPENIIFIWYVGKDSRYGYTKNFIFEPTLKDVEHYTSASISNGKRLSSTTDYYFFPDGAGDYSDYNNYGIMGMWDANNKILDLGFQNVSSRSGTNVTSNYTSQYYGSPVRLIIVYKT